MARKALLIGINEYRIPGANLRGCVNDVIEFKRLLEEFYEFSATDIQVLQDRNATKQTMQESFERLIRGARRGDVLFAHYSGHGSNVPDKSGDEADYRDEILCPSDLDWKDPFLDDWLRRLFDTVPEGVNLTVIMDCCHSGSNTRAIGPVNPEKPVARFLPCPLDLLAVESGRHLRGALRGARSILEATEGDVKNVDMPELLISGCRDDQTSADAYLDGAFCGALTHSIVKSLRESGGRLTYRELHRKVSARLIPKFEQTPQLEGRLAKFDRVFLGPLA